MKRILFTVTNDLTCDQRMQRICASLSGDGYEVVLAGRRLGSSGPLLPFPFRQKRIFCIFTAGFLFYAEYNIRLFFWLLFQKADILCAIDLDTILPVFLVSGLLQKTRVYDAHELFTEQKEIITRPLIHRCWLGIEKFLVPRFLNGYTVNDFIAGELKKRYGVNYAVIRNLPLKSCIPRGETVEKFIIYQGAVNEGRSFETLLPAMKHVEIKLKIYGNGNYFEKVKSMIKELQLEEKVLLMGAVSPEELKQITPDATLAVMLFEKTGLNQIYSLSNRFFDYIMAGVPQICVAYPEYKKINDEYHVALMIDDTCASTIEKAINHLLGAPELCEQLHKNAVIARESLNWQMEEKKLLAFYSSISRSARAAKKGPAENS